MSRKEYAMICMSATILIELLEQICEWYDDAGPGNSWIRGSEVSRRQIADKERCTVKRPADRTREQEVQTVPEQTQLAGKRDPETTRHRK
jgi:hypothetical protein